MILDLIGYIIQRQVEVRNARITSHHKVMRRDAHVTLLAINQEGFARYRSEP